jgi:hypothetical protein
LAISVFAMILSLLHTVLAFLDRICVGVANGCFKQSYDYVLDRSWKTEVHQTPPIENEMTEYLSQGIPKARRKELLKALDIVVQARIVFESCKPHPPKDHTHFVVVTLTDLLEKLDDDDVCLRLGLNKREIEKVQRQLRSLTRAIPLQVKNMIREESARVQNWSKFSEANVHMSGDFGAFENNKGDNAGRNGSGSLEDPPSKHSSMEYISKLSDWARALMGNWSQQPEATEVSFSHLVLALQPVCKPHCISDEHRVSVIMSRRELVGDDFSAYLY